MACKVRLMLETGPSTRYLGSIMSNDTESLISQLLDAARAAGADGADAGMSRSEGTVSYTHLTLPTNSLV